MWDPWGEAGQSWPHIDIVWWLELPRGIRGLVSGSTIWLCRTLLQAERRAVLAHELEHLRRGLAGAPYRAREERTVDQLAARRLITLPDLVDGLRVHRDDPAQLADHLWVDGPTLSTRMATLDQIEVAELENALADEWLWIP